MSKVEKSNRAYARCVIETREAKRDLEKTMSVESRSSERVKVMLREQAEQRVRLWNTIDSTNAKLKEARAAGDKGQEKSLVAERKGLYAALNRVPPVGLTHGEWEAKAAMGVKIGRPALGVDAAYSRAVRKEEKARLALQEVVREEGEKPAPLSEVVDKLSSERPGRPKNFVADNLRARAEALESEIQHIASGNAARERQAMIAERMAQEGVDHPDELSGRPLVPLSEMLTDRVAKLAEVEGKYLEAVAGLTPAQRAKHQRRSVARTLKRVARGASNDTRHLAAPVVAVMAGTYLDGAKPAPSASHKIANMTLVASNDGPQDATDFDALAEKLEQMMAEVRKKL